MAAKKVIIIGAGCAGLSAAYTLKKQGVGFTLFEASGTAGGRCRTVEEKGYTFSIGAGSTEPQWETTFQYLHELGLENRVFSIQKQRYGILKNGKICTAVVGGSFMEMMKTMHENIRFLFGCFPLKTYFQLIRVFTALKKYMKLVDKENHNFEELLEISRFTTEEFVLQHGGAAALEWMFHPFLATMVLGRPSDISIAHPISLFSLMKGMRSLEGGLGKLTETLYEKVAQTVRLSTPVHKVLIKQGKVIGVEIDEGFIEAESVICAVDAVTAGHIIPDLPPSTAETLESCSYSSTWYYQFALEEHFLPGDTDFFVLMIPPREKTILSWAAKGSRAGEKPVMIFATRGWEDEQLAGLSPEAREALVIAEARRIFPEFPEQPVFTKVFRWDRAVNLVSPRQFAAVQNFLKNHIEEVEGLHFAGEYLFPVACTEGALATGKAAAERIMEKAITAVIP